MAPLHKRSSVGPMRRTLLILFGVPLLLAEACTRLDPATPASPVPDSSIASVIDTADHSWSDRPDLHHLAQRLRGAHQALSIGTADREPGTVFGNIGDVVATRSGDILVLDATSRQLHIFDEDGHFKRMLPAIPLTALGVSGAMASRLVISSTDSILVLGRGVGAFPLDGPAAYHQLPVIPTGVDPGDMCLVDDDLYFFGADAFGTAVHQYGLGANHIRSFGAVYRSDNQLVVRGLTDGFIAGSLDPKGVLLVSRHMPYVWAYSLEGHLLWIASLSSFNPPKIHQTSGGKAGFGILADSSVDSLASLASIDGRHVLVQTQRGQELRSYVIDARDGKGLYIGNGLPLVRFVTLPRLYTVQQRPFPRVIVHSVSGSVPQRHAQQ
jgi:hypothetical protein